MGRPKGSKNKKAVEPVEVDEVTEPEAEEEVEAKPAKASKKVAASLDVQELLQGLFEKTLPQMIAMVVTSVKKAEQEAYIARQPKQPGEKCQDCGQYKIACKGKHREAVIYPTNYRSKWAKFFSGTFINGVRYLSSRPGHKVLVPEDSYPEHPAQEWERNEIEQAEGREAQFDSGVMSGRGNSTTFHTDARAGWRH